MSYEETRRRLRLKYGKDYEEYIKTLLRDELEIEDDATLDMLYEAYMNDEEMKLLNEEFEHILAQKEEDLRRDQILYEDQCRKEGVIY